MKRLKSFLDSHLFPEEETQIIHFSLVKGFNFFKIYRLQPK